MGDCISADIDIPVVANAKTIKDERVTTQIIVAVGQRAGGGTVLSSMVPLSAKNAAFVALTPSLGGVAAIG